MRKFRLIKEYPGSPKLGTIVEKDERYGSHIYKYKESNNSFGVLKYHVEDNPEYWEELYENKFMVSAKNTAFYNAYNVITVSPDFKPKEHQYLFYTKEEAEEFILFNKPCLSYSDLMWNFVENTKKNRLHVNIDELLELIKSKTNGK